MPNLQKKFSKEYNKNIDKIFRFVILKTGSKETAEDLTARVFTKGWEMFSRGAEIKNMSAYLFQIARAEIADYFQKETKFKIVSAQFIDIADEAPGQEEIYQALLQQKDLIVNLGKLKEDEQNILLLRFVEDFSIKEIAKILEKSEGAVRVAIHRALNSLRQGMEKQDKEFLG